VDSGPRHRPARRRHPHPSASPALAARVVATMRLKPPLQPHAVRLRGLPEAQPSGISLHHRRDRVSAPGASRTGTTIRRWCPRRRTVCRC